MDKKQFEDLSIKIENILRELRQIKFILAKKTFKRIKLRYDTKTQQWVQDEDDYKKEEV